MKQIINASFHRSQKSGIMCMFYCGMFFFTLLGLLVRYVNINTSNQRRITSNVTLLTENIWAQLKNKMKAKKKMIIVDFWI